MTMKKSNKKAKIIFLSSSVVAMVLVTFFVCGTLVLAADWIGPSEKPPAGNIEGLILNKSAADTAQDGA
jgi:hypothetical protein